MYIGICDDSEEDRKELGGICNTEDGVSVIFFKSGGEVIDYMNQGELDLLFLDVEMPGINGIELKNNMERAMPSTLIVFCTSHSDYMIDAFGRNVIFFLTKPYLESDVRRCIRKAKYLIGTFLPIRISQNACVPCKDIVFINADNKYSVFNLVDNKTELSDKSIKSLGMELVDYDFVSVSRGVLINLVHFVRIVGNEIELSNGTRVSLSRRKKASFQKEYISYISRKMFYQEKNDQRHND